MESQITSKHPSPRIWTIGHSTRSAEDFIAILSSFAVEALLDVRRYPFSRRHPHYSKDELDRRLSEAGISYEWLPELGGRRPSRPDSRNTAWRNSAFRGYADYMETVEFSQGMERLIARAVQQRTVITCAEAKWWQCHRSLIADFLKVRGVEVAHIMDKGKAVIHPYTAAAQVRAGVLSYADRTADNDDLFR